MNKSGKNILSEFLSDRYRLMAFIRAMVRDNQVAEDIFQEVWLRLDDTIKREVEIVNTASWCRGVAKNLILHHWRDQKRVQGRVDPELLNLVAVAFEEQDAVQEYWRARENALRDCIQKLPEHSIEILSLKYRRDLPIATVAARLNKTIGAVTKLLSRLRQKLRDCVTETLQTEGIS
ncbi:MAG: sigma-70 family RNA polymerase sigma factor [Deltaproteobacteria bacterium]|nr:sigma-70 family RNA polymerase sigma factor [Deltaproteobacteria bacterium]